MSEDPSRRDRPPEEPEPSRRDVLERMLGAGAIVWIGGVAVPAAVYLWPARSSGPGQEYVSVAAVEDFPVGTEKMVRRAGKPVMVLRVKEDEFRAFSAVCTHLACIVRWDAASRRVACPCHAGFFDAEGNVISGPPPRPLTPYRVVVVDDEVRVY